MKAVSDSVCAELRVAVKNEPDTIKRVLLLQKLHELEFVAKPVKRKRVRMVAEVKRTKKGPRVVWVQRDVRGDVFSWMGRDFDGGYDE